MHFIINCIICRHFYYTLNPMHFLSSDQDHSQFINLPKIDTQPIELNLNEYNQNSQLNPSISFTFFNQNSLKYPQPFDKNQSFNANKLDDNPEISLSIGFNRHLQNFFEHSLRLPNQDQFKTANIKKTPTFLCSQGFLNQINNSQQVKLQNEQIEKMHQKKCMKNKNNQNLIKSGSNFNSVSIKNNTKPHTTMNHFNQQHQNEQEDHVVQQQEKVRNILQPQFPSQSNLQNLRAIANLAFEVIKMQKVSTYQSISNLMLSSFNESGQVNNNNKSADNKGSNNSIFQNKQKKNKIIENMIKSKSFKGIELMGEIEEQQQLSYDSASRKPSIKIQQIINKSNKKYKLNQDKLPNNTVNSKNIRRRLYDAINVMISANIIEKKQNGSLTLKSTNNQSKNNKRNTKGSLQNEKQDQCSFEQLERRVFEKKKQVEAKRRYKELLTTKLVTLQKHINKNKSIQKRYHHNTNDDRKLYFPLIFTSAHLPMRLNLYEMGEKLSIQSPQCFDIKCDIDVIGLLYWVERQQIINRVNQIGRSKQLVSNGNNNNKRSSSTKDESEEEVYDGNSLRKKIKLQHKQQ